jgi:hypothetical protein
MNIHFLNFCKATFLVLISFTLTVFIPVSMSVEAAGIALSVSPSTQVVSTSGSITLSYTTSAAMAIGTTILVSYDSGYTGTLSTANTTVNGTAPTSITNATASGRTTATITTANAIASGTVTIVTSALSTSAAAGNYSFTVSSSIGDNGANFQYVGQANVVLVRGTVQATLSFAIRNSADTANTNLCDMGNLSTTAVGNCAYRIKVGTNATNGYTVNVTTSGNFTTGTNSLSNAAVGSGGSGGTALVAGTSGYGVVVNKGVETSSGATTLASAYNAGATNSVSYVNTGVATVVTAAGPNNPAVSGDTTNTSLVTHNAAIASDTPAGVYTQTATYTVIPSY